MSWHAVRRDHAVMFDRAFLGSKTGPSARLPECRDRRSSRPVRGHAECVRPLRLDGQSRALSGHRSKAYEGYAKRTIKRALAATGSAMPKSSGRTRRVETFRVEHGTSFRMIAATRSRLLLKLMHRFRYFLSAATCQSGYGAVCKTNEIPLVFNEHSEISPKFSPFPINRLGGVQNELGRTETATVSHSTCLCVPSPCGPSPTR
jgi:hypothetical protein